jgi:hypothetical protein
MQLNEASTVYYYVVSGASPPTPTAEQVAAQYDAYQGQSVKTKAGTGTWDGDKGWGCECVWGRRGEGDAVDKYMERRPSPHTSRPHTARATSLASRLYASPSRRSGTQLSCVRAARGDVRGCL